MIKQSNETSLWLEKVYDLTLKIMETVDQGEVPDKKDLDNRERLINLLKKIPSKKLTLEQIKFINVILAQDQEIIIKLEEISLELQKEIRKAFLNKKAISKFNLKEL